MARTSQDRTAVVTGAGSGIGRALALRLARRGGRIACVDIDVETAAATADEVREAGGTATTIACDVRDLAAVESMADEAERALGPVDLVVNNAGVGAGGRAIGEESIDVWRRTIYINLWGVVHGCHVFAPRLRALGRGGVINLASAAGFAAAAGMGPYNASKAAVMSISETLAAELAGTGITVTVVCPTFVKTAIVDEGEIEPDARALAERLMRLTGRSPDGVAAAILDGHDAGRAYVVPQVEARAVWAAKRHAPRTYLAGSGLLSRLLSMGRPAHAAAVTTDDHSTSPRHRETT
jgi:NAD(P)-dependent dehydrogenase (short-subunit alcohol dehydrogenase family)